MGVEAAIKSKKMLPVAGIDGQSFVATGVAGKKDGKVTFTFDRAFIGDYKHPAIAKEIRGVRASISATLSGLGEHKEVKLIQILRNIRKLDGKIATSEPDTAKRKARSGWDDSKARSKGSARRRARLGYIASMSPMRSTAITALTGGRQAARHTGRLDHGHEPGKRVPHLCRLVRGRERDGARMYRLGVLHRRQGRGLVLPGKPAATTGAVQELLDAATRWDGIAGNTKANL